MTKLRDQCYDPQHLQLLLNNQLDKVDETEVLNHMDTCPACQATLESLAADHQLWNELPSNLSTDPGLDRDELMETSEHQPIDADTNIQDLLSNIGPTDDPNMLGRIGTYEICGVVGRGSTGIVLKSFESSLNRYVAIKVLSPTLSNNGAARRRFEREARAIAAVVNEHVVPIYAVDEHCGLPYFVMQFISGASLQHRIERQGPLDACEVVRIAMQIANGLAAAHAQGIVHRDIKPANILLEHGLDRVLVSDFGLARVTDGATVTMSGMITGTPSYMAPEQARGDQIDQRSDLFSLGSVMYTMCTARTPFSAETVYGVIRRICEAEPRSIRESNPEIPAWLESFIRKLLSKRQADRFDSAEQVAAVLSHELAHLQNPTLVQSPPREWMETLVEPAPQQHDGSKRSTWISALWGGLAALALVAAGGFLSNGTADSEPVDKTKAESSVDEQQQPLPIAQPEERTTPIVDQGKKGNDANYLDKEALSKARFAAKETTKWSNSGSTAESAVAKDDYADATAVVYPVNGIKIDGDPSDWPAELKSYPIQRAEVGNQPADNEDLSASFKAGYSEADQALYVLVEVNDDSQVVDPTAGQYRWDVQDGCELYVDARHLPEKARLAQYTRYGDSLNAYGNNEGVKGVGLIVGQQGTTRYYEWRVDLEDGVADQKSMGFDVAILDKDQDGSFTWLTWGSGTHKIYSQNNHGNILLLNSDQPVGEIVGESNWSPEAKHAKKQVRLQSLSSPELWTTVSCSEAGSYRAVLPVGSYSVSVVDDADHDFEVDEAVEVTVTADESVEAEMLEVSLVRVRNNNIVTWGGDGLAFHSEDHLMLSSSYGESRNDSIAMAYPIANITIDGDLSDWPAEMSTYSIGDGKAGAAINDAADLTASYRVGYNVDEQAIYVAVTVSDESLVIDARAGRDWSAQDGNEIYLDSEHRIRNPRVEQFNFYGNALQYANRKAEVASKTSGSERTYEWRISTDEVISPGRSMGFDVAVLDKDDDDSFSWLAWGKGTQKAWHSDRCGNLLLLDPDTQFGTITGSMTWKDPDHHHYPRVCFQSLDRPGLQPRVAPGQNGEYSAKLPVGEYIVRPVGNSDAKLRVRIEPDEVLAAEGLQLD